MLLSVFFFFLFIYFFFGTVRIKLKRNYRKTVLQRKFLDGDL